MPFDSGHYADVERPAEVTVRWIDPKGTEQQETFDGLWATCVQHEIDHLNGTLFIDYLKPLRRQLITRKMVKLKKGPRAGKGVRGTRRDFVMWPDGRLKTPAADVPDITDEIRAIWADMIETMDAMPGVGLAAPQIGVKLRLAVGRRLGRTRPARSAWPTPRSSRPRTRPTTTRKPAPTCPASGPGSPAPPA